MVVGLFAILPCLMASYYDTCTHLELEGEALINGDDPEAMQVFVDER